MHLTDEQAAKVIKKLPEHAKTCPCGHKPQQVEQVLYELVQMGGAAALSAPLVLVVCVGCGAVRFFSARVLGVVDEQCKLTL